MNRKSTARERARTIAEAEAAGYWWRREPAASLYGPFTYGRPGRLGANAATEAEAQAGMITIYRADQNTRAAAEARAEAEAREAADAATRRAAADARAAAANAANADAAEWRITRRPDGLEGWSANGARTLLWSTVDAAIADQARDADRGRRHRRFRVALAESIAAAGGLTRWDGTRFAGHHAGTVLAVLLPAAHPKAPATGELVDGRVAAFTGRGWADVAEWWADPDVTIPDDYPDDA